jgi:hypothetical protein
MSFINTAFNPSTGNTDDSIMHIATDVMSAGVADLVAGDGLVTQNGAPNKSVNIAAGVFYVPSDTFAKNAGVLKYWRVQSSDTENVVITDNVSGNPRIDIICVKVDPSAAVSARGIDSVSMVAVAGTPAASPVAPAVPANHLKLAEVAVANGFASITTANITDKRSQISMLNISGPSGFLINGQIVPTVSSNNLTVAIKTMAGNDPSPEEPVFVRINNKVHKITAALSVTKNAGTNYFAAGSAELATKEIDYFVYLGYNTTDGVTIGFSRRPDAEQYSDFSATATNEGYCAISTITNAAAGDYYEVIGRFAATLSAGAGYTWTVPTFTAINLINEPIFETRNTLVWVPTITGFSSNPTNTINYYQIVRKACKLFIRQGTDGTSNATSFTMTLPFSSVTTANYAEIIPTIVDDNGTPQLGRVAILGSGPTTIIVNPTAAGGNFTASGGKRVQTVHVEYFI